MDKKNYNKPALKTRKIELGVFGSYFQAEGGRNLRPDPVIFNPIDPISRDRSFHMD